MGVKLFTVLLTIFGYCLFGYGDVIAVDTVTPIILNNSATVHHDTLPKPSKYYGYRLYITQIVVEKETDRWVKINCSIINTGKKEVDFSKKGREHWVQVLFDESLRSSKLGGFADNIRQALYNDDFKLGVGKIEQGKELKFNKILEWSQPRTTPIEEEVVIFAPVKDQSTTPDDQLIENAENCPDLIFSDLKIIEKNKKKITLKYTVKNVGKGPVPLKVKENGKYQQIGIRAFLSGAPAVSRASKEIQKDFIEAPYYKKELYPAETLTHTSTLKIREQNDFLKYLVLQIDSYALGKECDRRNNEEYIAIRE